MRVALLEDEWVLWPLAASGIAGAAGQGVAGNSKSGM
jgi:hypothetical protein